MPSMNEELQSANEELSDELSNRNPEMTQFTSDLDDLLASGQIGMCERKVTDKEGREYSLRVRPYRTTDNKIEGAVVTLVDIDAKKERNANKTPNRAKQASLQK
jgi:two-component system, chemotaxis family, CheB/CheR fusion protein